MVKKKLTFREQRKIDQSKMYQEYIAKLSENPEANKSEIKRKLAEKYGYTSETSVNTIIWKIEKENQISQ